MKEVNIGMTKQNIREILWSSLSREFLTQSICEGDSNIWSFEAKNGYYLLTFDNDTLRKISFSETKSLSTQK